MMDYLSDAYMHHLSPDELLGSAKCRSSLGFPMARYNVADKQTTVQLTLDISRYLSFKEFRKEAS